MSITTTSTKDSYTGNNSTSTPYPITFKYLEDSHITVYVDGVALSNSYYTLTGDGSLGTGQFTTALEYAGTQKVVVVLDVPFNQPVELLETGALSSATLEEAYDRLNMQIRRVWRKAQSVLTFSSDEGGTGSTGTADTLLGFDGSGDLGEIPNATFLQTANDLSDVTASTARTNLGVDAAGTDNSTDVTLAGTGTYISIAGQVITVDPITESDVSDLGSYIENVTGSPLSELQDVTITTPVSGEVLAWNGSAWVNDSAGNGDMLASVYDPNGVAGAIGTVQGTGAFTYNIVATNEGSFASTTARGEYSVDLQTSRNAVTQVAGGLASYLIAGVVNEVAAGASYSGILGGNNNTITSTALGASIIGGYGNTISGDRATVMVGANSTASGDDSLAVGTQTTASHKGAKMFGYGKFSTPFASKADQEFGIQADNFRLAVGTPAVGDVLTCNNADGSSNWAAPAKVVYTAATLPASPAQGDVAMVTDATATTFHSVVAGTGSNIVPVFYDGTNWRIG